MAGRRRRSSRSWRLPRTQRRDLYVARYLRGLVELVEVHASAAGADSIDHEWRDRLEETLSSALGDAFDGGAEPVADLASALELERSLRSRLESVLRANGLSVPTDRQPSEPPPKG